MIFCSVLEVFWFSCLVLPQVIESFFFFDKLRAKKFLDQNQEYIFFLVVLDETPWLPNFLGTPMFILIFFPCRWRRSVALPKQLSLVLLSYDFFSVICLWDDFFRIPGKIRGRQSVLVWFGLAWNRHLGWWWPPRQVWSMKIFIGRPLMSVLIQKASYGYPMDSDAQWICNRQSTERPMDVQCRVPR